MFDYGTAIVTTAQVAIGAAFFWLAQYFSGRISWNTGRIVLSWPCYGLAFLFVSSAAVTSLWNMIGPIVRWLLGY